MTWTKDNILDIELFRDNTNELYKILRMEGDNVVMAYPEGASYGKGEFNNTLERTLQMFNDHTWTPEEIVVKSPEEREQYTEDNIVGLIVRRGGTEKYKITNVYISLGKLRLKMLRNGRNYATSLYDALTKLNTGKWEVINENEVVEIYQIY